MNVEKSDNIGGLFSNSINDVKSCVNNSENFKKNIIFQSFSINSDKLPP